MDHCTSSARCHGRGVRHVIASWLLTGNMHATVLPTSDVPFSVGSAAHMSKSDPNFLKLHVQHSGWDAFWTHLLSHVRISCIPGISHIVSRHLQKATFSAAAAPNIWAPPSHPQLGPPVQLHEHARVNYQESDWTSSRDSRFLRLPRCTSSPAVLVVSHPRLIFALAPNHSSHHSSPAGPTPKETAVVQFQLHKTAKLPANAQRWPEAR